MDLGMIIVIVVVAIVIIAIGYFRLLVVVSPTEAHVISTGKRIKIFDGQGRYLFYSLWSKEKFLLHSMLPSAPKQQLSRSSPDQGVDCHINVASQL